MILLQNRFPRPDFESGYQYPDIVYPIPDESFWMVVDVVMLIGLMSLVAWAVIRKQTRKPILWVSAVSVLYFGFFRSGCVCSVGSIQNVALAFADSAYVMPLTVFLFFILPIVFAFFFGRVFCAGVCPFGALQELVHVKDHKLPRAVTTVLGILPWVYLIFAVLYAVTRSSFIMCELDPFVGFFRFGGDMGLMIFGGLLLIASIFIGRPFCRFLCPYGALLGLFSRVSIWKVRITKKPCINCELCHNSCPVDAIRPPYDNKVKETRLRGVKRVLNYFILLPLIMIVGALMLRAVSVQLSQLNKDVRLYNMIVAYEAAPTDELSVELEAFYGQEGTLEEQKVKYDAIQSQFKLYSTVAGALLGLVIGLTFIRLSVKRTRREYEIDHAACVACGRCFSYCPQNKLNPEPINAITNE
jgi:ferredoxin